MKTRNYGIDFLRMISLIMIVMLHTLGHGGILRSVSFLSVHYQIAWLLYLQRQNFPICGYENRTVFIDMICIELIIF